MKRLVCIIIFVLLSNYGIEVFAKNESFTLKNNNSQTIHIAIFTVEGSRPSGLTTAPLLGASVVGWFAIEPGQTRTFSRLDGSDKRGNTIRFAVYQGKVPKIPKLSERYKRTSAWCAPGLAFHGKCPNIVDAPYKGSSQFKDAPGSNSFDLTTVKDKNLREMYLKNRGWTKTIYYEVPYGTTFISIDLK
ncbi:MAG: hypothetical protein LBC74_11950 [Planctomycetaceae bacterium]|nr:hypothetical protein [Planctomycetaceae bacterium]